ncbi:MAG: adenylate cyclase [Actinomycetaceae bacterium]|nr:adenylate cyclase [Actinomycetaceae bacterium]
MTMHELMDTDQLSFEFERKFYISTFPDSVKENAQTQAIVQAYLFASEGYAVRLRLIFPEKEAIFPPFDDNVDYEGAYERKVLAGLMDSVDVDDPAQVRSLISVKSPAVTAERYEFEKDIDIDVAFQIIRRSPKIIVKNRYSVWIGEDGWAFDVFAGQNTGLIVGECERLSPVTNLEIPKFCLTEVSGDLRFTNDTLSRMPWCTWEDSFKRELEATGPRFLNL